MALAIRILPGISPMSDVEERAYGGDPEAFGTLLREHHSNMRGLVWSMLRDEHDTDDVLQSAYEKAFVQIERFERRSSFSTWLHSICYRTALDHVRYETRRRHEDISTSTELPTMSDALSAVDDRLHLADLIKALSPDERALLFLQVSMGHSYDELAEITGLPRGTLASKLSRLKLRLGRENS